MQLVPLSSYLPSAGEKYDVSCLLWSNEAEAKKLHDREQKLGDTVDHKNIRTARKTFHKYTIADKRKCRKYEV